MRHLWLIALLVPLMAGCDDSGLDVCGPVFQVARTMQRPVVDPPIDQRQHNWRANGGGSCVFAVSCTILNSQGRHDLANLVQENCGGPTTAYGFVYAMQANGIAVRSTVGDAGEFIDQCMSEGRICGAIVDVNNSDSINGDHMVAVVHADYWEIGFIDPNDPLRIEYVPRRDFLYECERCSGWVFTFEY